MRTIPYVCTLLLVFNIGMNGNAAASDNSAIVLENEICRMEFDPQNGGLRRILNQSLGDDCLKDIVPGGMPFRIFSDLTKEFEIRVNEKYQLVFDNPAETCREIVQPSSCQLLETKQRGGTVTLTYQHENLEIRLRVVLEKKSGVADWFLRITNRGDEEEEFLAAFPYLEGLRLGTDPSKNLATTMDQAGLIIPAWERPGGVLGESNQMSMQWHAIWDPASKSALSMIFMDPDVLPKRIVIHEPVVELNYFPPFKLAPGKSVDLPPTRVAVYEGDWRPAARAYHAWFNSAFSHLDPPEWFRQSSGSVGRHFKKGGPGIKADYGGQLALESFREIPKEHIRCPIDFPEYAFYCRSSMFYPVHTDGDNVIREDMGGPEAMREGIAGVHRLGLHTQLYVDGYVAFKDGVIGKTGKADQWAVMNQDGVRYGPYSHQGYIHMCPGCVEWQDHLADTVYRLLKETGADGVRIDSLGFYYLPCYNPTHHHETPFGYNEWIKQLFFKVSKAARKANPNVLISSEGSADWFAPYVYGALAARCPRDLPPMRIAMGPYKPYVYAGGAFWGSLAGFPGGGCGGPDITELDANWLCARYPANEALVWGDVDDHDPLSSDPEIVTRRFLGDDYCAIIAARPSCQDPIWPWGVGPSDKRGEYTVTVPGIASEVQEAVLCDIETLTWSTIPIACTGDDLSFTLKSNWALVILRDSDGPAVVGFDAMPKTKRGESTTISLRSLSEYAAKGRLSVEAPGLVVEPSKARIGEQVTISVPADAYPGHYAVTVSGKGALGMKRFLVVE